jgi:phosphoglycolate phosphatase
MLTIVFDLDGTLIDTAPDLIDTLNHILANHQLPELPFAIARPLIGGGAKALIERGLSAAGRTCSTAEVDRLYGDFIEHYAAHIADRSQPFPHLETTLDRLAANGHRLAVCTNKLEWLAVRLLKTLRLAQHFNAICGQDTFGVQKPDPQVLRLTVLRVGGELKRAVMIGDSGTDVRTARAAQVPIIAVDFGYTEVPISTLQPDRIIGSYVALPEAIQTVFAEHA